MPNPEKFGEKLIPDDVGAALPNQKGIISAKSLLANKPCTDERNQYCSTGLSDDGNPTLERTFAHEMGHSLGFYGHNGNPVFNLMRQSAKKEYPGMKLTPSQFNTIKTNIKNANQKRQFYL